MPSNLNCLNAMQMCHHAKEREELKCRLVVADEGWRLSLYKCVQEQEQALAYFIVKFKLLCWIERTEQGCYRVSMQCCCDISAVWKYLCVGTVLIRENLGNVGNIF